MPQISIRPVTINGEKHVPHRYPRAGESPAESQTILDNINKTLGFLPNHSHVHQSERPCRLGGPDEAVSKTLDLKTREGMALAVSEANGCDYCLAAHSYVSTN